MSWLRSLFRPKITLQTRWELAMSALQRRLAPVIADAEYRGRLSPYVLRVEWDERGEFVAYDLEASAADETWLRQRLDVTMPSCQVPPGENGLEIRLAWKPA
jgi:hypothetical protein